MENVGGTVSVTFQQEADCCSNQGQQYLTVNVKDGGGGAYIVFETTEWATDSVEEFTAKIQSVFDASKKLVEGDSNNVGL